MNNQLLEKKERFELRGSGETKQEAVERAFVELRSLVVKKIEDPIVHMIPNQAEVKELRVDETTEAFLFVFMKRIKRRYHVVLDVEVLIKYITL